MPGAGASAPYVLLGQAERLPGWHGFLHSSHLGWHVSSSLSSPCEPWELPAHCPRFWGAPTGAGVGLGRPRDEGGGGCVGTRAGEDSGGGQ